MLILQRFKHLEVLLWLRVSIAASLERKVIENAIIHPPVVGPFIPIIKFGVGTPPQDIAAILDTGSSDIVVPETGSRICKDKQQQCSGRAFTTGSFNRNTSFSASAFSSKFATGFANGVKLEGSNFVDTLTFGNQALQKAQFGLVSKGTLPTGEPLFAIAGLGPIDGEAQPSSYNNTPAQMKAAGLIKSNAFSLYLNDFRADRGSIIFGGVDKAKFTGRLQPTSMLKNNLGAIPSFVVKWSSFEIASDKQNLSASVVNLAPSGLPVALIDSGNPAISVPQDSLQLIATTLDTRLDGRGGMQPFRCEAMKSSFRLQFAFGKASIQVPMELITLPLRDNSQSSVNDKDGKPLCELAMDVSDPDLASLGAPFLQSAYAVFDMDNKEILFAQAILNATNSTIQEYPS